MTRILITSVRGKTGAPLAERLAARDDAEVLGGSSDPRRVAVAVGGVRPTAFSWDDPSGWPAATEGVDSLYLVRPDRPDAPELTAELVARTPTHAHVVLLSGQEAGPSACDGWVGALRREQHGCDQPLISSTLRPPTSWSVPADATWRGHDDRTRGDHRKETAA